VIHSAVRAVVNPTTDIGIYSTTLLIAAPVRWP
jgi:hypothetical protein